MLLVSLHSDPKNKNPIYSLVERIFNEIVAKNLIISYIDIYELFIFSMPKCTVHAFINLPGAVLLYNIGLGYRGLLYTSLSLVKKIRIEMVLK